ncbi:PREDICTED: uncharacterized protein LOC106338236 [Brassica oleracea var. oleracea]|uniref:uncharacterized protein LOC106338236 n=1 Tax=Brassica oleracea var. oleracea TaxID=109376 RepID=UPI0006A6F61F|nr:PREDICTED: uncharacterized protein LOC106338236 [Brassica oleracea var. oleracea]
MTITGETVFSKSDFSDDNPFLSLASYSVFGDPKLKTMFLIDIIGEVFELGQIQTVQVHDKDRKETSVSDAGLDVVCCLWGKYAEQFEEYIEGGNDQMLICLIRFAKNNIFRGSVQITNGFDASIVTLNPTMQEAIDFKQKLLQDELPLSIVEKKNDKEMIKKQEADWNEIEVRFISEILVAYEPGSCKIICSIESIDTDWGWFYFACNIHNTRVTKIGRNNPGTEKPLFRCEKCHANVRNVSPKYKLHLFIKDDSESCKSCCLTLLLIPLLIEDPKLLPEPVQNICGKSFCFGVSISSDNVTSGADTFFAAQVWTNDTLYQIESAPEPVSNIGTSSSNFSGGEVSVFNPNSRSSSEGVSTPFSKRKEDDAEVKDITSTSKKLCTKNIKLKKAKND